MARIFAYLLLVASLSTYVSAVPVQSQAGNSTCDAARQETMKDLQLSSKTIDRLTSSKDPNVVNAAMTAQGGLKNATAGFTMVTSALKAGQDAPADAMDQVSSGLLAAQSAMSNVTSTSHSDTGKLKKANSLLNSTIVATQDVVSQCGGGSNGTVDGGVSSGGVPATGGDTGSTGSNSTVDDAPATGAVGDGSNSTLPSSTVASPSPAASDMSSSNGVEGSGTDGIAPSGTSGAARRRLGFRFARF